MRLIAWVSEILRYTPMITVESHPNMKEILQNYMNQRMPQKEMLRRLHKDIGVDIQ